MAENYSSRLYVKIAINPHVIRNKLINSSCLINKNEYVLLKYFGSTTYYSHALSTVTVIVGANYDLLDFVVRYYSKLYELHRVFA